jgi:hypothetical protein
LTWISPTGRRFVVPGQRLTPSLSAVAPSLSAVARPDAVGQSDAGRDRLARFAAPSPECDDGLPASVIPYRKNDGTVDYLDTREPGPWAPNAAADPEPPPF